MRRPNGQVPRAVGTPARTEEYPGFKLTKLMLVFEVLAKRKKNKIASTNVKAIIIPSIKRPCFIYFSILIILRKCKENYRRVMGELSRVVMASYLL